MSGETSRLYYEAHVTIDPVFGVTRYQVECLARVHGFKLAKLVMMKDGSEHTEDAFMTARSKQLDTIKFVTAGVIDDLKHAGFTVRRWKIEDTLYDSRSGDAIEDLY